MAEEIILDTTLGKAEKYDQIIPQIESLIEVETDRIANLANIAAVLKYSFNFLWVGFYIWKEKELILGPFQGPLACTRIQSGKGVCGTSFEKKETIIVPNVDEYPGHIACSSHSKSEIVIPIFSQLEVVAVLDVDSSILNDFNTIDKEKLEKLAEIISAKW